MRYAVTLLALAAMLVSAALPAQIVMSAYLDQAAFVHVVYGDGRDIKVPAEKDQVKADPPVVAPDGQTVGWTFEVPNCCTSYPIPTTLIIYSSGRVVQRIADGMMVYKWQFWDGGKQVAVSSGTVHGMNGIHLTLYDARTGKRLKTWDGEDDDVPPDWGVGVAH